MTESGFVKAQSDNLPKIDAFMMTSYFASNPDFVSAEVKGVKASRSQRESYGDSAVGQKCYNVQAICNETEETIISVQCEDCPAHLGGCKHAIAFLAWLHRRSEDPPCTSVVCYWKKSKLSSVGTSLKLIKAKDIFSASKQNFVPNFSSTSSESFLTVVKKNCMMVGDINNHLMKFYQPPTNFEKLSIHQLIITSNATNPADFIEHCKLIMSTDACKEAAVATIGQNDCPLWHELRYGRITASKVYEAAHCKVLDGSLTESILGARKLKDTEAMKRGRFLENEVVKDVEKIKQIKINKCGLKLNSAYPTIGASSDGASILYSIGIKCPTSEKAFRRYITKKNEVVQKYMAQLQLQMHFSNKTKGLFCVAHNDYETTKKVTILEVDYDKSFCETLLEKCMLFWHKAIFPKIIIRT